MEGFLFRIGRWSEAYKMQMFHFKKTEKMLDKGELLCFCFFCVRHFLLFLLTQQHRPYQRIGKGRFKGESTFAARRGCRGYIGFAKRPSLLRRRSFSNSTADVHAGIPEVLENMVGIKTLTIGYTKDIELAESRPSDWRASAFHPDLSGRPFAELE